MFTGIIEEQGKVIQNTGTDLAVRLRYRRFKLGESISINGVCLSVVKAKKTGNQATLSFDVSPETLEKTHLGSLRPGSSVNVERPLPIQGLLGGHIVQGHVDGQGVVKQVQTRGDTKEIWFEAPKFIIRQIVPKGSIAVNGVSLTVAGVHASAFSVSLIPITLSKTNLIQLKAGDVVNLETDIIAKYVSKYMRFK